MKAKLVLGDCLEVLASAPPRIIDLVLVDPPYGITQNSWDSVIPIEDMWRIINKVSKPNAAIVILSRQPFTSALILSNLKHFKYCCVWDKVNKLTGHLNSKKQPLRKTEDIVIFYKKQPTYNPQMRSGKPYRHTLHSKSGNYGGQKAGIVSESKGERYPHNIISIPPNLFWKSKKGLHPTQKPVELMEYLIKTYTNKGDTVLDFAMGSGTTGVACRNLHRNFIGVEKEREYFDIAYKRIKE